MSKFSMSDLSGYDNIFGSMKVNVEKDGNSYDWSFSAPNYLLESDNSLLLNAKYTANDWLSLFNVMPEIFAPINEIATRVSNLKFVLRRFSDDEIIWDNKNFNRLFASPNPLQDFKKFVWTSVVYEMVTGASFVYVNKPLTRTADFDSVKTLTNIPTNLLKIDEDKTADPYTATEIKDFIKRLYQKRANGSDREFDLRNISCIINSNLTKGMSVKDFRSELEGVKAAIINLIPVYIARNQIYLKRGALGFIVSKKQDESGTLALTKPEVQNLKREFVNQYGVTGQASTMAVTETAVDFVKTSSSIQEMQPFEETELDARAIYAGIRVPKHLCPTRGNSTFSNAKEDMETFYRDVIIPKGELYCQSWTNSFAPEGHYFDIDTSGVDVLQEDKKQRADTERIEGEVWEKRFKHGICTLNDWVVATGGEASNLPLYQKRIYEMSDEEKLQLNLSTNEQPRDDTQQDIG